MNIIVYICRVLMIVHKKCEITSGPDEKNIIFFVISFDKIISLEG